MDVPLEVRLRLGDVQGVQQSVLSSMRMQQVCQYE